MPIAYPNISEQFLGVDQTPKSIFGSESAVAVNVETEIASYTVPADTNSFLILISVSGQSLAQWTTYKNNVEIDTKYTSTPVLNDNFNFKTGSILVPGLPLVADDVIKITARQLGPLSSNMYSRIYVLEIPS
jgi:hypothetical protein